MKKQSFLVRPIFLGMFVFFSLVCIFLPNHSFATEQSAEQSGLLEGVAPDQVDSVLPNSVMSRFAVCLSANWQRIWKLHRP